MASILFPELRSLWGPLEHCHPVRPTDTPGVLLALQPGAAGPAPHPARRPPHGQSTPCCQAHGKLPCPGPRQDGRLGDPGGTAVRQHRRGAQETRSGHGPRSRSMDTGCTPGGVWATRARSDREQPHPATVLPKSDNRRSRAQDDKQEEGA